MSMTMPTTRVHRSSGNVYADLRLPNAEEEFARCQLAAAVCATIAQRGLTQFQAAKILGLDQPKVSALMRGKLDGFSADRLLRFLNDLGQEVEIVIKPVRGSRRRGRTSVRAG